MENKYYIPSVDEFHVGFEFELGSAIDKNRWDKCILRTLTESVFDVEYNGTMAKRISVSNRIRVKYLDKEDIESLGFELMKSPIWFTKKNVSLFNSGVYELRVCLWPREDNVRITISYPGVDEEQIFTGRCKNKSELVRILKMIGYEN